METCEVCGRDHDEEFCPFCTAKYLKLPRSFDSRLNEGFHIAELDRPGQDMALQSGKFCTYK